MVSNPLSKLQVQWKVQQQSKPGPSRWKELYISKDDDNDKDKQQPQDATKEESFTSTVQDATTTTSDLTDRPLGTETPFGYKRDKVYLLEPPNNSLPSSVIVFVGGAGIGEWPHIAYGEFLTRVSNQLNAAILAVPYQIDKLDHFALAKQVGELARKGLLTCEDDTKLQYSRDLQTFLLCHSLGCKLASLYVAATDFEFDGMGFISFNNFGFGRTISMVKDFASTLSSSMGGGANPFAGGMGSAFGRDDTTKQILNQVFDFAESAISTIGIEFTPSPQETERLFEIRWNEERQRKTRFFSFDKDTLHDTERISELLGRQTVDVSQLEGNHLTPVFYRLGLDQLDIPPEAEGYVRDAIGGIQSASFGDEAELDALVSEVCNWILGKEPSVRPKWQQDLPQIVGEEDSRTSTADNV